MKWNWFNVNKYHTIFDTGTQTVKFNEETEIKKKVSETTGDYDRF